MSASQILCMACGYQGSFGTQEISMELSMQYSFKYLGNDPFTGAMHYQCPECKSHLDVDPMHILRINPARGQLNLGQPRKNVHRASMDTDFLWQLPGMIKDGLLGMTRYIGKNLGFIL